MVAPSLTRSTPTHETTAATHQVVGPLRPREAGDRDLPALLQNSAAPVVVESYHAGWEVPWRGLTADDWRALLLELGERVNGVTVETGRNREFAVRHGLEVIPGVLVFLGGQVVARFTGRTSAGDVAAAVRSAVAEAHAMELATRELDAAGPARERLSPVRSRRRASRAGPSLAQAG